MTVPPIPFDPMEATLEESGAMQVIEHQAADIERKNALLGKFVTEALAEIEEHPVKDAIKSAELLHHADREYSEYGCMPLDTYEAASEFAHSYWRDTEQQRRGAEQETRRGIG